MSRGIGRYMGNMRAIDFGHNLIGQVMVVIAIIPIWWWCMC